MRKPEPRQDEPAEHELVPELQQVMRRVGKERYARATAEDFAKGGKYHSDKKRARYAID
jgi:hypothetical protein